MSVLICIQTIWHSDSVREGFFFFEKVNFEKSPQTTTKAWKITQLTKELTLIRQLPHLLLFQHKCGTYNVSTGFWSRLIAVHTVCKVYLCTKYVPLVTVGNRKLFFFFLNPNILGCGYSNEPSQWDGSFEHPKRKFKLIDKEKNTILLSKNLFY